MLNQASFYGYIAFDVALRTTSGGREYVNNALNVRRNFKGNDGKYGYDSIPFSIFGPQARVFAEHCKKGNTVILSGNMQSNLEKVQIMDNGIPKSKTINRLSLNVQSFDFVSKQEERNVGGSPSPFGDPYNDLPC